MIQFRRMKDKNGQYYKYRWINLMLLLVKFNNCTKSVTNHITGSRTLKLIKRENRNNTVSTKTDLRTDTIYNLRMKIHGTMFLG